MNDEIVREKKGGVGKKSKFSRIFSLDHHQFFWQADKRAAAEEEMG